MKIIRQNKIKEISRPYGRTIKKLLSCKFKKPAEGVTVFLGKLPNGKFDKHYHTESSEIIIFPKGGKIRVNGKLYNMQEWDLVFLDPGDVHSCDVEYKDVVHLAVKFSDKDDKIKVK